MEEKEIINENQEIKEETPVEEVPVVEEPTEEVNEETPVEPGIDQPIEIQKPNPEGKPYDQVVEEERQVIMADNKKSRRLSTISIIAVLTLSVTGLIILNIVPIVAYVLMGCSILVLIVFSIIIRRVTNPDVKGYIVRASTAINEFTFADKRFTNVKYDPSDKLELKDISGDGAFAELTRVASRNVCEGLFDGRSFKVCETAFFKGTGKKQAPVFIGKYISTTNDLHFEGRIILISKGEKDEDIPDGLDGLVQVENEGKFFAYAPDEKSYKDLDKKFIKAIKKIEVSAHLLNLTVIIWAGRTIIYASYDDATITLPFYETYQPDTAVQYRDNLIEILEAAQLLKKE